MEIKSSTKVATSKCVRLCATISLNVENAARFRLLAFARSVLDIIYNIYTLIHHPAIISSRKLAQRCLNAASLCFGWKYWIDIHEIAFIFACLPARVCVRFQFRIHSYTRLRRSCVSVSIVTICQQLTLSRGAHNAKREDSAILLSLKLFLPLFVDTQYCSMLIKKNVKVSVILYTKCVCAPILFFISR